MWFYFKIICYLHCSEFHYSQRPSTYRQPWPRRVIPVTVISRDMTCYTSHVHVCPWHSVHYNHLVVDLYISIAVQDDGGHVDPNVSINLLAAHPANHSSISGLSDLTSGDVESREPEHSWEEQCNNNVPAGDEGEKRDLLFFY